ncbi:MAG: phosphatase PAP2 family protein [Patescibacteria group bacterium]|nr:phosphatase PAP2 family protein [Patescibacteria group bacterium]
MNETIVFIGSYVYLASVAIFISYFFYAKRAQRRRFLLLSVFTLPLSYLSGLLAGTLYYDPRPFVVLHITPLLPHAADNGFPSDHALLMGTIAAIVTVFSKRLGIVLWILAILVGAARVLAGVHHILDILGSFIIAIGATTIIYGLIKRYLPALGAAEPQAGE